MIALVGGDITETCKSFAVVGNARQNAEQQTCGIVEPTGHEVLLRGGESVFNMVIHGAGGWSKVRSVAGFETTHCTGPRIASLQSEAMAASVPAYANTKVFPPASSCLIGGIDCYAR